MDDPGGRVEGERRLVLDGSERRVLGVLIEKGLTTPQSYPMSLAAVVSGCNQKSNRDPITHYDEDQVEDILDTLRQRDLVSMFHPGEGGRVFRWRQDLGKNYGLRGVQIAIIGELLLRGPQSEGDLRQRAARMRPVESLDELRSLLEGLAEHHPPFVERLTPPGVGRGVRYSHTCYPDDEMEAIRNSESAEQGSTVMPVAKKTEPQGSAASNSRVEDRLQDLEQRIRRLEARFGEGDGTP